MAEYTLRDFLDLEAIVDDGEEEEELDEFFVDDIEDEESEVGPSDGPALLRDASLAVAEASELQARARDHAATSSYPRRYDGGGVPRHLLVPRQDDPDMWAVRVKVGYESSFVLQICRRCLLGPEPRRPDIASVLARDGIPGYIFLEGSLSAARQAVDGLVTVLNPTPRLIPFQQRVALLESRNPLSRPMEKGQWVRCLHGLYRDDVGFVRGHDDKSDSEVIVALVPRIPTRSDRPVGSSAGKRKRVSRPPPRAWSSVQVATEWGVAKVHDISPGRFEFRHETYESGLIMKHFAPDSLAIVDSPPDNIQLFIAAPCIRELPSFTPWVHRFAQDSLQPQQRVRVESGEHRGIIGRPVEIIDGVAAIVPDSGLEDVPLPQILLRSLTPHYLPGDNVKDRWSGSYGLVMLVDEVRNALVYVEKESNREIATLMDNVEFFEPPHQIYKMQVGTWVEFRDPDDPLCRKRRGYVRQLEETHALVVDETSWGEFKVDVRKLDVCAVQAVSLPKGERVHPLVGQRVQVTRNQFKGYYALVKDVGSSGVTIEIEAQLVAQSSALLVQWTDFKVVSKTASSRLPPLPRPRTPPPDAAPGPSRTLTPEPEREHWLLSPVIRAHLQSKRITFHIRGIRGSGDGSMDACEDKFARTVPVAAQTFQPRDGEVIVSLVRRVHREQISIDPKFLVPLALTGGKDVVVIDGPWFGIAGVIVGRENESYVVRFTLLEDPRDELFEANQLANLEALRP